MNVTIDGRYQIRPHGAGDMCFELWSLIPEHVATTGAKKGEVIEAAWRSLGRYPSTFEAAVNDIIERLVKDSAATGDARACIDAFHLLANTVRVSIESAKESTP